MIGRSWAPITWTSSRGSGLNTTLRPSRTPPPTPPHLHHITSTRMTSTTSPPPHHLHHIIPTSTPPHHLHHRDLHHITFTRVTSTTLPPPILPPETLHYPGIKHLVLSTCPVLTPVRSAGGVSSTWTWWPSSEGSSPLWDSGSSVLIGSPARYCPLPVHCSSLPLVLSAIFNPSLSLSDSLSPEVGSDEHASEQ